MPTNATGHDFVSGFEVGTDLIGLDIANFRLIGIDGDHLAAENLPLRGTANTADQRILYMQSTGDLFFDRDGSQNAFDRVLIAEISNKPILGTDDFVLYG